VWLALIIGTVLDNDQPYSDPGGGEWGWVGRILPPLTLDIYNFYNKEAKATKLGDFS